MDRRHGRPARRALATAAVLLAAALLASCASRRPAPVEERGAAASRAAPPAATAPAAPAKPEADWRPSTYTVKRGDTLYQIALDHGLDYRELASWNGIENPNRILVGQVLRLTAPGEPAAAETPGVVTAPLRSAPPVVESRPGAAAAGAAAAGAAPSSASAPPPGARNTESYKSSPKAVKEPWSAQAARDLAKPEPAPPPAAKPEAPATVARAEPSLPPATPPPTAERPPVAAVPPPGASPAIGDDDESIDWIWPAKGRIVGTFSEGASLKGIDIAGTSGQPVLAAAAGKVVYAGSGLRGYGKLVIIKHNKLFLSAYAHNREILVKEGQQVARGQKIAEMGNTDADQVKLHFEIRRLGKPMDPSKYLPPA